MMDSGKDGSVDWSRPADMVLDAVDFGDTEESWSVRIPLKEDQYLDIRMGEISVRNLETIVLAIQRDRALAAIGVVVPK